MLLKLNRYIYLSLAIFLFIVAAFIENGLLKQHPEKHLIEDFQKQLIKNENELDYHLKNISEIVLSDDYITILNDYLTNHGLLLNEDGVGFLVYKNGELQYWSDRSISFYDQFSEYTETNGFIKLPNGYYLINSIHEEDFDIVGLYLIKYNYEYQNKYLKNTFFSSYNLPDDYAIKTSKDEKAYSIFNKEGDYLFSIMPAGKFLCTTGQLYFPGIIYLIGLLILLFYFRKEFVFSKATFFFKLFTLGVVLFIVYWLHLIFHIPKVFSYLPFFSSEYFAYSSWLPSLGDFFLMALFFFFWMYNFASDLDIEDLCKDSFTSKKIVITLLVLFAASTYLLVNYYIGILIENSTISFSFNQITQISSQSVMGIFSIGLFLLADIYFTVKVFELVRKNFKRGQILLLILVVVLFLAVIQLILINKVSYKALAFFMVVSFPSESDRFS